MNKLIYSIVILSGAIFSFQSCEKVIEVPLDESEQQVVVEGVGRNFEGESYVLLSKTGSVYQNSGFERLSGANVTVTDQDANVIVFTEDPIEAGRYMSPAAFIIQPNSTYDLNVTYEDRVMTSSSTTKSTPAIDTLTYIPQFGGFGPGATDTTFLVFYSFTDNGDEENFYRARVWVNGERDDNFYITTDELFNGANNTMPFFATTVESGDTCYVELLSMDEANYTYLFSLQSNANSGPFAAVPSNPVSNVENAIGYFGGFMIDTMTIVIP